MAREVGKPEIECVAKMFVVVVRQFTDCRHSWWLGHRPSFPVRAAAVHVIFLSLSSEPICHSFWTKANGGSYSETGESADLRIFVNRDFRNGEDGGQLGGSHGAPKPIDLIDQSERLAR